ncbi:hypothetical protein LDENG_00103530 [Lucifuga dentata]|nr:hypothetical protein LDENG_00103530 [Lucifuga dentata]
MRGLGISNGDRWRQLKRWTIATMAYFFKDTKKMEERIQDESKYLLANIEIKKATPFDPTFDLKCYFSNIFFCLMFGQRSNYDDDEFLFLANTMSETLEFLNTSSGKLYNLFPNLMGHLPGCHQTMFNNVDKVNEIIRRKIREHESTLDPSSPRDFIDYFLIQRNQEKESPMTDFNENLVGTVFSAIMAGLENLNRILKYTLGVLSKYPDFQEKIQKEIDTVIGRERFPTMEDRKSLPFTNAVMHEVLRMLDVVPFAVGHYTLHDISFRDYTILQDTTIVPVLHSALREEKYWVTPDLFNPQHFLDDNGNFKLNPAFIAFSAGNRQCPGQLMAHMAFFLSLVALLQRFFFACPGGPDNVDLNIVFTSFPHVPPNKFIATQH